MASQEPRHFPAQQDNDALFAVLTVSKNIGQKSAMAVLIIGGVVCISYTCICIHTNVRLTSLL